MASQPMEDSLWQGYARQKLAIHLLRELRPELIWTSFPAGGKFDLLGYQGPKIRPTVKIAVEIRFRYNLPEKEIMTRGVMVNENKLGHALEEYDRGAKQCIFLVIADQVGIYTTEFPRLLKDVEYDTVHRKAELTNTGKYEERVAMLKGYKKLCPWETYMLHVQQRADELILPECLETIKELYGKER